MMFLHKHAFHLFCLGLASCSIASAIGINDQPHFDGPGIYSMVPYLAPYICELNSWGGNSAPGEPVKIYKLSDNQDGHFADNERWQFTLVSGNYSDGTYLLFNVRNGYYLSATRDGLASLARTPTNPSTLWKVSDASGSSGGDRVFTITQADGSGQIYVPGGVNSYNYGSPVKFGKSNGPDNAKFYIVTKNP